MLLENYLKDKKISLHKLSKLSGVSYKTQNITKTASLFILIDCIIIVINNMTYDAKLFCVLVMIIIKNQK